MENARRFWNKRYINEGPIWGVKPATSAKIAAKVFKYMGLRKIMVPGCAYGRNSLYFARSGFDVLGLDASPVAIDMAKETVSESKIAIDYQVGNVYQLPYGDDAFEAIFDRGLLHLMLRAERRQAIIEYRRVLLNNGALFLTVFSTKDPQYGRGVELEENTFDSMDGRPAHFFTRDEMSEILKGWQILNMKTLKERETHGAGEHFHNFLLVIASPVKEKNTKAHKKIPATVLSEEPFSAA